MAQSAADDLVRTIQRPFRAVADAVNRVPSRKPEYTDMHAKMVDAANKSFRDAAAKKEAARKPASKKEAVRKTAKKTASRAKGRSSSR